MRSIGFPDRPATIAALLAIVYFTGAAIRFSGIDWDGYTGLNPDERHMIFVMSRALEALRKTDLASALSDWFITGVSIFDPRANESYVYGDLPNTTGALFAYFTHAPDGWAGRLTVGRLTSAAADSFTILLVFAAGLAGRLPRAGALAAAALYAVAPLAIQHAHFYVSDVMATAFGALALVTAMALARHDTAWRAAATGLAIGAAMACKIPLGILAMLVPAALAVSPALRRPLAAAMIRFVLLSMIAGSACFIAFRLLNPSAFAGPGLLDIALSERFVDQETKVGRLFDQGPFGWQWTVPGVTGRAAADLALWCLGPGLTGLALIGAVVAVARLIRAPAEAGPIALALVAALLILVPPTVWGMPAIRYAFPAVPALAVLGGLGCTALSAHRRGRWLALAALLLACAWGQATYAIYVSEHPRIAASRWIWDTLPVGATIVNETPWDDPLPVTLLLGPNRDMKLAFAGDGTGFRGLWLDVTDDDSPQKIDRMVDILAQADLLVVSSGRQWRVMPRLPQRFPITARYYAALFDGRLCFAEVARFDKPFTVLGVPFDDSEAQEHWRVYDRPDVRLYRRQDCFSKDRARTVLEGR